MSTFQAVTDEALVSQIEEARSRVVFVAPGITRRAADALVAAYQRRGISVAVILDGDPDAYRIGYGDPEGLAVLHQIEMPIRLQPGLRIALVITEARVTIWSPTPRAVDSERKADEPNGIVLQGDAVRELESAVGPETAGNGSAGGEIGNKDLSPARMEQVLTELKENPPAPFDLSRKTRVFATKFQYVEFEVHGVEWTQRKVKLSSLLLNADVPEELQDILETVVRPFQAYGEVALDVQAMVGGVPAYDLLGNSITKSTRQKEVEKAWEDIRDRYLVKLKGFGWLIRRVELSAFRCATESYEQILREWVGKFRDKVKQEESALIDGLVEIIRSRMQQGKSKPKDDVALRSLVTQGLQRMRVVEPRVRIVVKDVSWESTRDEEFTDALRAALPAEELEGWFEEFTAAKART